MSSLSDVMSAALAMMMSAALVHFGVTGGSTPDQKQDAAKAPAAAHANVSSSSSESPPVPTDDDRFSAPVNGAAGVAPPHVARARHNS